MNIFAIIPVVLDVRHSTNLASSVQQYIVSPCKNRNFQFNTGG